ncbi:MAG: hypothetical protein JO042_06935 [Sinobacteraceae bacterium]|nr:hypothetical protein [Nevskiaceae bacterium]
MTKVVFAACLLVAISWAAPTALAKDPTQLMLRKGARVGIINLMDAEVTQFHASKVLAQSFLKTHPVKWQVDSMLSDAVTQRLTQLELVPVAVGPSDTLMLSRDELFVNNSVAKGLPREASKDFGDLAAANRLDAMIVLAPGLNNSAQAGNLLRKALPDYLRGWGFVTSDTNDKPSLFNMTQVLLIGTGPKGCVLDAREWGGAYAEDWTDYVAPENPKQMPPEQLDHLQPVFSKILAQQTGRLMEWITVSP